MRKQINILHLYQHKNNNTYGTHNFSPLFYYYFYFRCMSPPNRQLRWRLSPAIHSPCPSTLYSFPLQYIFSHRRPPLCPLRCVPLPKVATNTHSWLNTKYLPAANILFNPMKINKKSEKCIEWWTLLDIWQCVELTYVCPGCLPCLPSLSRLPFLLLLIREDILPIPLWP